MNLKYYLLSLKTESIVLKKETQWDTLRKAESRDIKNTGPIMFFLNKTGFVTTLSTEVYSSKKFKWCKST